MVNRSHAHDRVRDGGNRARDKVDLYAVVKMAKAMAGDKLVVKEMDSNPAVVKVVNMDKAVSLNMDKIVHVQVDRILMIKMDDQTLETKIMKIDWANLY